MTAETNTTDALGSLELERLMAAARDSLSDEMVGRLAGSAAEALDLVDKAGRAGLARAIPTLAEMINNGDLERLAQLARVYHSAQDALTDEMVGRLAETLGEGLSLMDRLNRGGAGRLVEMLERMQSSGALEKIANTLPALLDRLDMIANLLGCLESAACKSRETPAAGGLGNLWHTLTDANTIHSLQFLVNLSQQMQERCGSRHA